MSSNYIQSVFTTPKVKNGKRPNVALKRNVFMTYEHTSNIRNYVIDEDWGKFNKRLFSYLDYTFRARLFDREIYIYKFNNNISVGLFYIGLQSKKDKSYLYMVFRSNPEQHKKQDWALPKDTTNVGEYLMSKDEIIKRYGIKAEDLPKPCYYIKKEDKFNPNWRCDLYWDAIFRTILNHRTGGNARDIILKEFEKNGEKLNPKVMRQQLVRPFESAVDEARVNFSKDDSYVRHGVFFLQNSYELVLQMLLNVEYPRNSGKITKFAVVIEKTPNKNSYEFKKLLNIEMAYKNARLISTVPKSWQFTEIDEREFKQFDNNSYKNNKSKTKDLKIRTDLFDTSSITTCSETTFTNSRNSSANNTPQLSPNLTPTLNTSPIVLPTTLNTNNNNNNNNNYMKLEPMPVLSTESKSSSISSLTSSLPYKNIYPKFFKAKRERILTLVNNGNIIETINESNQETSNIYSKPIISQNVLSYNITNINNELKQQLLISPQLKIQSQHEICQMSNTDCIETIYEIRTFMNGKSISSMKSYLTVVNNSGIPKTSELNVQQMLNNMNNNNKNNNNINTFNKQPLFV